MMNEVCGTVVVPRVTAPRITRQDLVALKSSTNVHANLQVQCIRMIENVRSGFDWKSAIMILFPAKTSSCARKGGHVLRSGVRTSASLCADCNRPIMSSHDLRKSEKNEHADLIPLDYWVSDDC